MESFYVIVAFWFNGFLFTRYLVLDVVLTLTLELFLVSDYIMRMRTYLQLLKLFIGSDSSS